MTVLYFAWVREKVGVSQEAVDPPESVATAEALMSWLAKRSPGHEAAFADRKLVKIAVDQVHVPPATNIRGAKEIAFFPPVTGG